MERESKTQFWGNRYELAKLFCATFCATFMVGISALVKTRKNSILYNKINVFVCIA